MVNFSFKVKNVFTNLFKKLGTLNKIQIMELSILLSFAIIFLFYVTFNGFFKQVENIRNTTLRIHVKANSDLDYDQKLKLQVRDEILKETANIFTNSDNKETSKKVVNDNINYIEEVAQQKVFDEGYNYKVTATIKPTYFNTRNYNTFQMPSGVYDALSVDIGSGDGQNWWCVLYPPLCLPPATNKEQDELMAENYNKEQVDVLENPQRYQFKFKIFEIFESIKNLFS